MRVWGTITTDRMLKPYPMWHDELSALVPGDRLRITVEKDRNGKFSSLFHLMLSLIAKAINRGPATTDVDQLKKWIKLRKGWFDVVTLPNPKDGITHVIDYRSTSFAKMGEDEFHRFCFDACDLIRTELAPWIGDAPEWNEARAIIDSIMPRDGA